ncbi:hypothetical protein I5Q34_26865 [Streptomyces sp. AV19]|uniref:hypothetical protein n=1 Tax=Streptomyces sp. AV19 TaxID=2793068 RepID=UPI0018FF0553|nr:hypothetical protein [Streptomyces sp. AV19]MBH1937849.1 hypothetical protein [Streptomyces sp. AV19]MDG4537127.1 hypothetical protein [Streptomyces sp. AV19]
MPELSEFERAWERRELIGMQLRILPISLALIRDPAAEQDMGEDVDVAEFAIDWVDEVARRFGHDGLRALAVCLAGGWWEQARRHASVYGAPMAQTVDGIVPPLLKGPIPQEDDLPRLRDGSPDYETINAMDAVLAELDEGSGAPDAETGSRGLERPWPDSSA